MTDSKLTQEQAAALLARLVKDEAYRTLFETKPAQALAELTTASGAPAIPHDTIVRLPAACLCPRKLASVETLSNTLDSVKGNLDASPFQFVIPQAKI